MSNIEKVIEDERNEENDHKEDNNYNSDEDDDDVNINDLFLIQEQAAEFTHYELMNLGFETNIENIKEIYWEVLLNGMQNENILKVHQLFITKIGHTSLDDMLQVRSNMSDEYIDCITTDTVCEYDPIIKRKFGLTFMMPFPSIDWHEVVDF